MPDYGANKGGDNLAFTDLRQFLAFLENEGELARVQVPVDTRYEIGAVCRKVLDERGPALLFEQPRGFTVPVATLLFGTRRRVALALGTTVAELQQEWLQRTSNPLKPRVVDSGPCQENVLTGERVDLRQWPIPVWNEQDGGPFITLPCHISQDPVTGGFNAGIYRGQVFDSQTIGIHCAPYRHLAQHRAQADPAENFPVAIALGLDPAIHIASAACFPAGTDELAMAGALRGEPVDLVQCKTVPLMVPAYAEIVLEGEIVPGLTREEGLFGECTGYYGIKVERPVIRIKAITHRNNPIYMGACVGRQPEEAGCIRTISTEAEILKQVALPGIKAIHLTEGGCGIYHGVVAINKPFEGYGKMMGMAVLGTWGGRYIKHLVVVDADIDPFNMTEVEWAVATRVQPHRDVEIIRDVIGHGLDPSIPQSEKAGGSALTSKMLIDATRYHSQEFETPCRPHPKVMQQVLDRWAEYGIRQ